MKGKNLWFHDNDYVETSKKGVKQFFFHGTTYIMRNCLEIYLEDIGSVEKKKL